MVRKESDVGEGEGVRCEGVSGEGMSREEDGVFEIVEYPQSPQRLRKFDPMIAVEGGMCGGVKGEGMIGEGGRGVDEKGSEEKEKDEEEEENSVYDDEGTNV